MCDSDGQYTPQQVKSGFNFKDVTHLCSVIMLTIAVRFSVTVPLDIVGVWTVGDRRRLEPGLHLVHHL